MLFSGSLRSNMDPEDTWPDHKLWEALAAVQLKEAVVKVRLQGMLLWLACVSSVLTCG